MIFFFVCLRGQYWLCGLVFKNLYAACLYKEGPKSESLQTGHSWCVNFSSLIWKRAEISAFPALRLGLPKPALALVSLWESPQKSSGFGWSNSSSV